LLLPSKELFGLELLFALFLAAQTLFFFELCLQARLLLSDSPRKSLLFPRFSLFPFGLQSLLLFDLPTEIFLVPKLPETRFGQPACEVTFSIKHFNANSEGGIS